MNDKNTFYLLPLKDYTVFPRNSYSLIIGREKSVFAIENCMQNSRLLVVATQTDSKIEEPTEKEVYKTGVLVEVLQLLRMPDKNYKVFLEGIERVMIKKTSVDEFAYRVEVEKWNVNRIYYSNTEQEMIKQNIQKVLQDFSIINKHRNYMSDKFLSTVSHSNDFSFILDSIVNPLSITFAEKQEVLEALSLPERVTKVKQIIANQLEILELEKELNTKIKKRIDDKQKQYYLNEKIKVIKDELGDNDNLKSIWEKINRNQYPPEILSKIKSEIKKLEATSSTSVDFMMNYNYLECLTSLPWNLSTKESLDIKRAREQLDSSHYSLEKVKQRLLEFISVQILSSERVEGGILCFVGPSGIGKTSLAMSVADALGRKFVRISLGGIRDEAEIRGHRRTYVGALPGRFISSILKAKVNNPVVLLDEIDKISYDFRGNPWAALLEVLDPVQNKEFYDHYLEVPFDLSNILFIATANSLNNIPSPLLDRLEVVHITGYTEREKVDISKKFLVPKLLKKHGIEHLNILYNEKSLIYVIRHYSKESGVRQLERSLAKLFRKIAYDCIGNITGSELDKVNYPKDDKKTKQTSNVYQDYVLHNGKNVKYLLDKTTLENFLGPIEYRYNQIEKNSFIGKTNGLAWTQYGGEVLFIESTFTQGSGKVVLTGNLGDVMKESVEIALGYIKSQKNKFSIPNDFFSTIDVFLHIPEGSTPKDGPSAGIAIAVAIASAIQEIPIDNKIALTGEITLLGNVLPVGGIKEKTLAAYVSGITDIICPIENKKDIIDIPNTVKEKNKISFCYKYEWSSFHYISK